MKATRIIAVVLLFFCKLVLARRNVNFRIMLDTNADSFMGWKLVGDYLYFSTGEALRTDGSFLPSDLDFQVFHGVRGIWALFPVIPEGHSSAPTRFSISYRPSAQLLDNVEVVHSLWGDAKLSIRYTGTKGDPIVVIKPPKEHGYSFKKTHIHLNGTSRGFTVEGTISQKGSFILLDSISASFTETTTTTRPPSSTSTTRPPVSHANKSTLTQLTIYFIMLLSIVI